MLARYRGRVCEHPQPVVEGRLTRMVGLTLEAVGCRAAVGGRCLILGVDGVPFAEDARRVLNSQLPGIILYYR